MTVQPTFLSRVSKAPTGAMVNHSGSRLKAAAPTIRAVGFRPNSVQADSEATSSAAAPSLMLEALPAVIVP